MKKIIVLSTAFLLTAFFASAQNTSLIAGVSGGAHLTKVKGTGDFTENGESFSRSLKYGGGVDLGIRFGNFSILSGVRYNQKGGESELNYDDPNGNFWIVNGQADLGIRYSEINYNVLSIPILLRYSFGSGPIAFTLAAGPVIQLINGKGSLIDEYDLINNGRVGPYESTVEAGKLGDNLFKKNHVAFQFRPGFIYNLNDNGNITFNVVFESSGNMANESYLVGDGNGGVAKASGSIKGGGMGLEIGYEHRFHFNVGSKY